MCLNSSKRQPVRSRKTTFLFASPHPSDLRVHTQQVVRFPSTLCCIAEAHIAWARAEMNTWHCYSYHYSGRMTGCLTIQH